MKTSERPPIIFLGNGLLADCVKATLAPHFEILFHARTAADLAEVRELKLAHPEAHAILASFGVLIKKDLLALFEPAGILNIHPSLLPEYRGASPIESAIKSGQATLGVSIMKLAPKMDAGPIYYQKNLDFSTLLSPSLEQDASDIKSSIYRALAEAGATWLVDNLQNLPTPTPQDDKKATFCAKLDKSMSKLALSVTEPTPGHLQTTEKTATALHREIIAHALYPRSKIAISGTECLILASHIASPSETPLLTITASDGQILSLDRIQPAGKRPMDPKSFKNGYLK